MIQNIIKQFGRGEITLTEMWKQIDNILDIHNYHKTFTISSELDGSFTRRNRTLISDTHMVLAPDDMPDMPDISAQT